MKEQTSYAAYLVYKIENMKISKASEKVVNAYVELLKKTGECPKNLNYIKSYYDKNTGICCAFFEDIDNGNYILSFAGTNFYDRDKDIYTDIVGILLGQGEHYSVCFKMYRKLFEKYGRDIVLVGHSLGGSIAQRVAIEYNVEKTVVYNAAPIYMSYGVDILMAGLENSDLYKKRMSKYKRVVNKISEKEREFTGEIYLLTSDGDIFTRIMDILNLEKYIGKRYIFKDLGTHSIKNFLESKMQQELKKLLWMNEPNTNLLTTKYKKLTEKEIGALKNLIKEEKGGVLSQIKSKNMTLVEMFFNYIVSEPYGVNFKLLIEQLLIAEENRRL